MSTDEKEILSLLADQHADFAVREHRPIYTAAQGCELDLPGVQQALKSLLLTDDRRECFYLLVLPAHKRLDLKELRSRLGSRRLTMASPEELCRLLSLTPGAVTPLGLLNDAQQRVRTVFDRAVREETVAVPLISSSKTIWLPCRELVQLLQSSGHIIEFLEL